MLNTIIQRLFKLNAIKFVPTGHGPNPLYLGYQRYGLVWKVITQTSYLLDVDKYGDQKYPVYFTRAEALKYSLNNEFIPLWFYDCVSCSNPGITQQGEVPTIKFDKLSDID